MVFSGVPGTESVMRVGFRVFSFRKFHGAMQSRLFSS